MCKNVLTYNDEFLQRLSSCTCYDDEDVKISSVCDIQWNYGTNAMDAGIRFYSLCGQLLLMLKKQTIMN